MLILLCLIAFCQNVIRYCVSLQRLIENEADPSLVGTLEHFFAGNIKITVAKFTVCIGNAM